MSIPPGSRLGPYEIRSSVGAGGMGEVYRAHDPRLGRDVALKILPDAMAGNAESLARFTREARAVAALNHPHIVTIFSTEEADGVRFMSMELIEGRALDRMIPVGGVSLSQFFDISMALADALSAAHEKKITHRDLKPANVMVTDSGRVKVLDFGLARSGAHEARDAPNIEEGLTREQLTQAGTILGTMPYMSPEQIEAKPLDHRTDIFSLGIVMYEMATGGRPFRGDTSAALMSSIMKDHPKPLTDLRPDAPEGVARIVSACLEKHVRDRVQSAQEILLDLKAVRRAWESGGPEAKPTARVELTTGSGLVRAPSRRLAMVVAPFTTHPADPDMEGLARGLTEDITTGLARFPDLTVRTSRDAETRYIVEGSVRRSGSAVRTSVRLVDCDTGVHLWAESYDRSLDDLSVFDLQGDLASRTVATVAGAGGVLVRSMTATLKDRRVEELTVAELVLRHLAYTHHFRSEEHERLRTGLERALAGAPAHALGWACLSSLYEQEHSQGLNPLPDSLVRAAAAAERAVEIDPTCQAGWRAIAALHFFNRDRNGLRMAAERAIPLNPLSSATVAYLGMVLAQSGDWDHGIGIVRRAMDLNPHHPGWFHFPLFADHYRRGEYDDALTQAKGASLPQSVLSPLSVAVAAAQLGQTAEAGAAMRLLRTGHPAYLDPDNVRRLWSLWLWERDLVETLMDGFAKAQTLVGTEPSPASGPVKATSRSSSAISATSGPSGRTPSIAVLPFTDMSPAKDQDWFCDGIAEEILNALSQLKGLRVAARGSAFSFKSKGEDLLSIGEKLNVTTILEGSVRRAGDRVRITVQLNDVRNGFQLWSERYDREIHDIFDLQDEIARTVADRLKVTLASLSDHRLVAKATDDVEAYQVYLKGRALLYKRGRHVVAALEQFQKAVSLDPGYALAWAGIADVHSVLAYLGATHPDEVRPRALMAAQRAIELDPGSAEAHNALACALLLFQGDTDGAEREFQKALELNPDYSQARCWYAFFHLLLTQGRFAEGVVEARRALKSDPLSPYVKTILGLCVAITGEYDEGESLLRAAVLGDPVAFLPRWSLGTCLLWAQKHEEAATVLKEAADMSGQSGFAVSVLTSAFALSERLPEAEEQRRLLKEKALRSHVALAHLALAAEALGDVEEAIPLAQRACEEREPAFLIARHWPGWAWLRKQPQWPAMLRRLDEPPRTESAARSKTAPPSSLRPLHHTQAVPTPCASDATLPLGDGPPAVLACAR